jgi:hypothetical protein
LLLLSFVLYLPVVLFVQVDDFRTSFFCHWNSKFRMFRRRWNTKSRNANVISKNSTFNEFCLNAFVQYIQTISNWISFILFDYLKTKLQLNIYFKEGRQYCKIKCEMTRIYCKMFNLSKAPPPMTGFILSPIEAGANPEQVPFINSSTMANSCSLSSINITSDLTKLNTYFDEFSNFPFI